MGTLPPLRRAAGLVRDYSACLFFLAARQGAVGQLEQVMDPLANARLTLFHSPTISFVSPPAPTSSSSSPPSLLTADTLLDEIQAHRRQAGAQSNR